MRAVRFISQQVVHVFGYSFGGFRYLGIIWVELLDYVVARAIMPRNTRLGAVSAGGNWLEQTLAATSSFGPLLQNFILQRSQIEQVDHRVVQIEVGGQLAGVVANILHGLRVLSPEPSWKCKHEQWQAFLEVALECVPVVSPAKSMVTEYDQYGVVQQLLLVDLAQEAEHRLIPLAG